MISDTEENRHLLSRVRLLAMDIDGVLTDGSIIYSSSGGEYKSFHVADGLGIRLLPLTDVEVVWITGRKSDIVQRRAEELGIRYLFQGVGDKGAVLQGVTQRLHLSREQVAYIGDDWNDLLAYEQSGCRIAVANAVQEIKEGADMVTERRGGEGAVREVIDGLLDARGIRAEIMLAFLNGLRQNVTRTGSGQ